MNSYLIKKCEEYGVDYEKAQSQYAVSKHA